MPSLFSTMFKRDRAHCVYCGKFMLIDFDTFYTAQKDHLVPGGPDTIENIVLACFVCNNLKSDFVPDVVLSPQTRTQYICEVRVEIMTKRAKAMADFTSWTHASDSSEQQQTRIFKTPQEEAAKP